MKVVEKPTSDLSRIIDQVAKDRGVSRAIIIDALEAAMLTAARKKLGLQREIEPVFNEETGDVELFEYKEVVDVVANPYREIQLEEALVIDADAEIGDELGVKIDSNSFGRISAQMAKQVIIQRVRDAEKENIYNEYKDRKGEIINGIVRRFERGNLIVDLGRAEAILPVKEQIPREKYNIGDRIRGYILDVKKSTTSPQIVLSRASVEFLAKLFEMEVPEIYEGVVQIRAAAREPGSRAKIAVVSFEGNVDPVGACVGMKGSRVQSVVAELRGEKIDIIEYSENPAKFVCNALAPADILKVIIDEDNRTMDVIVADDQLSLAIGKRGQNVRLAAKLTQWRIDIHSENQYKEMEDSARKAFTQITEINDTLLDLLIKTGYKSLEDLADATVEDLMAFPGVDEDLALAIMDRAYDLYQQEEQRKREAAERGEVIELGAPQPAAPPVPAAAVAAEPAADQAAEPAVEPIAEPAAEAPPEPAAPAEIYQFEGLDARILAALDEYGCRTKDALVRLVREADGTALYAVPGLAEEDIETLRDYVEKLGS